MRLNYAVAIVCQIVIFALAAAQLNVQQYNAGGTVNPCQNGGQLMWPAGSSTAQCTCPPGFQGSVCETSYVGLMCASNPCLNGGLCVTQQNGQFLCSCQTGFVGQRCEIFNGIVSNKPNNLNNTHCNYTITLKNEAGYVARMQVLHSVDRVRQSLYTSPSVSLFFSTSYTVPYYATDIVVTGEKLGLLFSWDKVFNDTGLNPSVSSCTKCYKVYGTAFAPKWDHVTC